MADFGLKAEDMIPAPVSSSTVRATFVTEDGVMDCYGTTVPTAADIYAPACTFKKTTATGTAIGLYVNKGTKASPSFTLVSQA
jgi:hypothetical protein